MLLECCYIHIKNMNLSSRTFRGVGQGMNQTLLYLWNPLFQVNEIDALTIVTNVFAEVPPQYELLNNSRRRGVQFSSVLSCCDVHFPHKTMFGSSLPPVVCIRDCIVFLCMFAYNDVKPFAIVHPSRCLCLSSFCVLCT